MRNRDHPDRLVRRARALPHWKAEPRSEAVPEEGTAPQARNQFSRTGWIAYLRTFSSPGRSTPNPSIPDEPRLTSRVGNTGQQSSRPLVPRHARRRTFSCLHPGSCPWPSCAGSSPDSLSCSEDNLILPTTALISPRPSMASWRAVSSSRGGNSSVALRARHGLLHVLGQIFEVGDFWSGALVLRHFPLLAPLLHHKRTSQGSQPTLTVVLDKWLRLCYSYKHRRFHHDAPEGTTT